MTAILTKRFSANQAAASAAVRSIQPMLRKLCKCPDDVNLALTEAVTNVVNHAYPETCGDGVIEVGFLADETVVCTISDNGAGVNPKKPVQGWNNLDEAPENGFGLLLMSALAKQLTIESDGQRNIVKMTFEGRCPLAH